MGHIKMKELTPKAFSKYGRILLPDEEDREKNPRGYFYILEQVESKGWRMAYLESSVRQWGILSNHPNTKETFEPLEGCAILVVAPHEKPDSVEAFVLDKPIVLNEGVWHSEPIALSSKVCIRINENLNVKEEKYVLPYNIKAELFTEEKPS